ncbi:MAG: hypothetical protein Q9218_003003 [Villophora microphyllina]
MYRKRYGDIAPTQKRFDELKSHYQKLRDDFRNHPRSSLELEAWKNQDHDFDYQLLNGHQKSFIPTALVGKSASPDHAPWGKSDTFFSEYASHNSRDLILSETPHSYIIGNVASYDGRQYPLSPYDKRPEGQGFCHSLVIPKARVYNVVDPEATANNCFLLKEMHNHFIDFWENRNGKSKILERAKRAVDDQDQKLRTSNGDNSPIYDDKVRSHVFDHFDIMKSEFAKLHVDDFLFGFHVFPDNSIGHLHMHVFPHGEAFRSVSTKMYDWKTVPLDAVLEVEGCGGR